MFVVPTGTTVSCCLGRQYEQLLRLSFLDVYGCASLANEGKSAANRWQHGLQICFVTLYSEKSQGSKATKDREKNKHRF